MTHKGVQLLDPELPDVTLYQSYGNFRRPAAAAFNIVLCCVVAMT